MLPVELAVFLTVNREVALSVTHWECSHTSSFWFDNWFAAVWYEYTGTIITTKVWWLDDTYGSSAGWILVKFCKELVNGE